MKCVLYARISVATDTSVSIDQQIERCRKLAEARGWDVVGVFTDVGVSATYNKPEDRRGWRDMVASPQRYGAVIVLKVDRLARKVLDFLHADQTLQERGAGLVTVEGALDMTTAQGRAFATMLAVFAEMEAEAIRARVKAARTHLLRVGRVVGGTVPYGWRKIANPDGPGYVLGHDPERIEYVRTMAERTLTGRSLYSTVAWLDDHGAPLPTASQTRRKGEGWSYQTVERLLRNPILAGMTPFNPDNTTKIRGDNLLRGEDGLPVVDESVAILPATQWRAMVTLLNDRDTAQARPVAMRAKTSGLLSGLVWCGEHDPVRMWRGTSQGRPSYYCPECSQTISNFEHVVLSEFLRRQGGSVRWTVVSEVDEGGRAQLPEIERAISDLRSIQNATDDDAEYGLYEKQIRALRQRRQAAREKEPVVRIIMEPAQLFEQDWDEATTDEDRRDILGDAIERITVRRGGTGRRTQAQVLARLAFTWKQPPDSEVPDDATLADWAADNPGRTA